jgi:phage terminase small subunit
MNTTGIERRGAAQSLHIAANGGESGELAPATRLQLAHDALNERERVCCDLYMRYGNKVKAWREAYAAPGRLKPERDYRYACEVLNNPRCTVYLRELRSEAAAATVIDVSILLAQDRAIVDAHEHMTDLVSRIWVCCRYCYGIGHAYQWRDENEYLTAYAAAVQSHADKVKLGVALELVTPTDEGGYGFDQQDEPAFDCPKCDGHGEQRTLIASTATMSDHARVLYKGIKETKNGIEVLTHDYDKAKDRLYRAAGAFGDDAASVARGAASGAVAGVAAAAALAKRVESLTEDDVRKGYLQLIG